MEHLLEIKNATIYYGKALAVADISLTVAEGEIVTIIGSNGAGKTTILNAIAGLVSLRSGEIWFDTHRIDKEPVENMIKYGIAYCMEGRRLFPVMTVLDNLESGAITRKDRNAVKSDLAQVFERFPILKERSHQKAGTLSGGEQQMVTIGRALMARPKLLIMDEPTLGLAPIVIANVTQTIKELNDTGLSVLLIEQNAQMALSLASRGYVMEVGKIIGEGDTQVLKSNEYVKHVYLGICEEEPV